ncbi:ribonuclease H1-like [Limulus polyphemus]|uniref:Ribonuclease H1 n=1 Tax=Limulus polyphemus TaxID=6850 RepID=A0ABM1BKN6_LIMPO|nr:ribonuclease H1-like [Limulus polyphemus]XP_022252066.1 ribonuclease H1-like [Limulus polyphemus]XP_022252067.1 ribonuclease H1-like [Limulus polyphemus]
MLKISKLLRVAQFIMGKGSREGLFYAVRRGRVPGVYFTWPDCEAQVKKFPNASFKKFGTEEEAWSFVQNEASGGSKISKALELVSSFKIPLNLNGSNAVTTPANKKRNSDVIDLTFDGVENCSIGSVEMVQPPTKRRRVLPPGVSLESLKLNPDELVHVYTDGACSSNGRRGARAGIGVFWGADHPLNVSERLPGRQTNNRAEIHAAVRALDQAQSLGLKNLVLYTDSAFLIKGITMWIKKWKRNGWKLTTGESVKNQEDFEALDEVLKGLNVKWIHVRGHRGIHGNEAADRLAVAGMDK